MLVIVVFAVENNVVVGSVGRGVDDGTENSRFIDWRVVRWRIILVPWRKVPSETESKCISVNIKDANKKTQNYASQNVIIYIRICPALSYYVLRLIRAN